MRPPGDPAPLTAVVRGMAAAADELDRLGRQTTAVARDLVTGGGWTGPASRAYLVRDDALEADIRAAATALRVTGEGLAGLAAGLAGARATWDRARALAASSGLALDIGAPPGPLALPLPSTDPTVVVAARVTELLHEADERANAADRMAAARFAEAARLAAVARPDGSPASAGSPAPRGNGSAPGPAAIAAGGEATPRGEGDEDGGALGRALDLADRVAVALGAGFAAVGARAQALLRLVRSGHEPAASLAAARALAAFERSALTPTMVALLPAAGPPLTLAANLVGHEHDGEPMLRAVVRSLGESLGADVGQRLGIAACGVDMGATGGSGAVLCPAITIVAASAGAALGGATAVRIYDALGPASANAPEPEPAPQPGAARAAPAATGGVVPAHDAAVEAIGGEGPR